MKNNLVVFKKNKPKVIKALKDGRISYVADSKWSFACKFYAFLISIGFFPLWKKLIQTPGLEKTYHCVYLSLLCCS